MKHLAIFLVAALVCSFVHADSIALRLENDCLLQTGRDEDYTHGTGLEYWYKDEWRFTLQQNMYTPNDIKRHDHIVGDRPYAGWLGVGIGKELFKDSKSPWTHFAEIHFGMIGPSAKAGKTQKFIHKILDCRTPNGWDNQLADEFCINAEWWTKYNWYICDYVALIPRAGVLAGTIEDGAEVGCDLKIGWNIKHQKDIGNNMMFSSSGPDSSKRSSFWDKVVIYGFVGGDCRYYLYNHFLEGSMFNKNDSSLEVDIEPFVGELQFGAYLEVYGVFIKWYGTTRTYEYKNQKQHPDYGGLYIGYRWDF